MKDVHKEFARRSIKDAAYLAEDVEEEYGIQLPEATVGQFALAMYQHRVQRHRYKEQRAEQEAQMEEMDPKSGDTGRY